MTSRIAGADGASARETAPPVQRANTSTAWLLVVLVILVAGGAGGWFLYREHMTKSSAGPTTAESPAQKPIPVLAATAKEGNLPVYLNALGSVTALNSVTVRTRVDGQIDDVKFTEGQLVHEGDVLIQIDPRPFQVQLEQAQAQLAKDQSALKNAQLDLDRYQQAQEAIPQQQLATQRATVDQLEAATKIDQSQIDSANLQLTYSRVISPITGRIGLRLVDKGNIVHASEQTGLAMISQLHPITVVFSISEDDLPSVLKKPNRGDGLVVEAFDRNLTQKLATGSLAAIDNQVDPTTGTIKLKAKFENPDETLFPNQFVNVRLLLDTIQNAVLVPTAAVQRGPDSSFVYVVKGDQGVEVRTVTTGESEQDQVVVESGLKPGEIVVTDGVDKLDPAKSKVVVRQAGGRGAATRNAATEASS